MAQVSGKEMNPITLIAEIIIALLIALATPIVIFSFFVVGGILGITIGITLGTALFLVALILATYRILAPNNLSFAFVYEATARFVSKGGGFSSLITQWKGHTKDEDGYIVPTNTWVMNSRTLNVVQVIDEKKGKLKIKDKDGAEKEIEGARKYPEPYYPLGGLRLYGLWPISSILFYDFAWTGVDQSGKTDPHPKEHLGFVILTDDNYYDVPSALETKSPENLPLDTPLTETIRIANPHKAIFVAEKWLEITQQAIRSITKDFVALYTYTELIAEKDIGKKIMEMAEEKGIIDELFYRYGIELRRINVLDVRVTEKPVNDLQKLTLENFKAKQQKEATILAAEAESMKRAKESTGAVIQGIAESTGEEYKDVQKRIKENPELSARMQAFIQDMLIRKATNVVDIRVAGTEGMGKDFLALIAAYQSLSPKENKGSKAKDKKEQE